MDLSWIVTSWSAVLMVVISTIGIYIALIAYTRMAGLRSFSKMSSFDFAITGSTQNVKQFVTVLPVEDPELINKLREANVTQLSQVYAVIMEATGDISVMHNDSDEHELDDILLKGVRGWES